MASKNFSKLRNTVMLAALTAIVLILQLAGVTVRLGPTNVSLVLIPIVFGAVTLGPMAGAWLGLVFGVEVFVVLGAMGGDPTFTAILFNNAPIATFFICIVKSTLAGYLAGVVYALICTKNQIVALFAAAAVTPIVNTGVFVIGCFLLHDVIAANFVSEGVTVVYYILIGLAGVNFLLEFALNMVVVPALGRIVHVADRILKNRVKKSK